MALLSERHVPVALWRTVARIERGKVNTWIAYRNALAIALPLAVGIELNAPLVAVAITTGALNVSFSDGHDPYPQRARRMLSWSLLGGVAVFIGAATGGNDVVATLVAAVWAFLAGLLIAVGSRAGDLGLNTLVTVIVFASRPMTVESALGAGALVFAGGVLQTAFALLLWPVLRRQPEREAVGEVYAQLAAAIHPNAHGQPPAFLDAPAGPLHDALNALGRDHTVEGGRYRLLFDQASRLWISAFALRRAMEYHAASHEAAEIKRLLEFASDALRELGQQLSAGDPISRSLPAVEEVNNIAKAAHERQIAEPVRNAMDALAGQLRAVMQLGARTAAQNVTELSRGGTAPPWKLQLSNWMETLQANLDFSSAFFRHGVRLAVCVAVADAIGRGVDWRRTYWIPMTVAVILKPDFGSTFSRGALRLLGTFSGLLLATFLYHVMPVSGWSQLLLVGAFALMMRWIGPTNYGVFSAAVAGLVVFLIAATGVAPIETVKARGLNTAAGGVLALAAYVLWPTWERKQIRQTMAEMLDRCREYLHAAALGRDKEELPDEARLAWRLARSNAEAAVDRLSGEPGATTEQVALWNSILASSHSVAYSAMVLETERRLTGTISADEPGRAFLRDAEFTLYFLAAALRGTRSALEGVPNLRKSHGRLVESRESTRITVDSLVEEADRLTVSLNTLREQVARVSNNWN